MRRTATGFSSVTRVPARHFGLDCGAIAPGRQADLVVFSDLREPRVERVFTRGIQRVEGGKMMGGAAVPGPVPPPNPMAVPLTQIDLAVPARGSRMRVIELTPDQILTGHIVAEPTVSGDQVLADSSRDLLKIAVVERYTGRGGVGLGFVRGFHLKRGAIASSVAHDSHNLIVVGTNDADMRAALAAMTEMGGGLVAADGAEGASPMIIKLPLPIGGLMTDMPLNRVRRGLDDVIAAARGMGCTLKDPFMALSFLALPVIPSLKITDKGLVDVARFQPVGLFVD